MKTNELKNCPYCNGTNLEVWKRLDNKCPDLLPLVECGNWHCFKRSEIIAYAEIRPYGGE